MNIHLPFNSVNLLLDINPAETCPYLHQKTYSEMFIAVLFIAALNSKQPKYPSTLEWINVVTWIPKNVYSNEN